MQRYKYFFNYQNKYFYFKFIFAGCFAIYGKQYIFVVPHQPNIALGYCVKFPRCILIYDAGGLFISYSDNTTICKFRRNIRFPILLFIWYLRRTRQMLRTHILTGFHSTQIQCNFNICVADLVKRMVNRYWDVCSSLTI